MISELISLAVIAIIAVLAPMLTRIIPGRAVPETVILIFAGALLGPNLAGVITLDEASSLLSDLGLAFLFLLAGYEIDPKNLTQGQGLRGLITWLTSFAIALALLFGLNGIVNLPLLDVVAIAIALTTTAIGTLMPILKERRLLGTPVGNSVLAYGTWGELAPIVAIALLLGTRAAWKSLLVLLLFVVIAVIVALRGKRLTRKAQAINKDLEKGVHLNAATRVRVVVMLLVCLLALAAAFDLDIILGAFAAGFILRYLVPQEDESFLHEVDAIAYGFFIPLFFVLSGAGINFGAVLENPLMLILFILLLLLVRGVPIMVSLWIDPATKDMTLSSRCSITFYCVTALPLIVAVTSVAVSAGTMSSDTASIMVAAGAVTVLIMPLLSGAISEVGNMHPVETIKESRNASVSLRDLLYDRIAFSKLVRDEGKAIINGKKPEGNDLQSEILLDRAKGYGAVHPNAVVGEFLEEKHHLEADYQSHHDRIQHIQQRHELHRCTPKEKIEKTNNSE